MNNSARNINDLTTHYYDELYNRNSPLIAPNTQLAFKHLRIGVAGCGSTGGAFVEGALRAGIAYFHLADNGSYELNNLNRQMVTQHEIGKNKALVHEHRILAVNPYASVRSWNAGITESTVDQFLENIDFLFDAVDVTTIQGMKNKLLLHERAAQMGIPTGSALDLGFTQWLKSYNYHQNPSALDGKLAETKKIQNPLKAIIKGFIPIEDLPNELCGEIIRLIQNPQAGACQLGSACFLLSSMVTPYLMTFIRDRALPEKVSIDLMSYFDTKNSSDAHKIDKKSEFRALVELLDQLE